MLIKKYHLMIIEVIGIMIKYSFFQMTDLH